MRSGRLWRRRRRDQRRTERRHRTGHIRRDEHAPPPGGCEAVGIELLAAFQAFVDQVDAEQLASTPPLPTLLAFLQPPPGVMAEWADGAELVPFAPIVRAAAPAVLAANQLGCDTGELAPVAAERAAQLEAASPAGRAFIERLGAGE